MDQASVTTSVRVALDATTPLTPQLTLDWAKRYAIRVAIGDTGVLLAAVAAAYLLVFHIGNAPFASRGILNHLVTPMHLALVIAVVWMLSLRLLDTRAARII